MNHLLKGLGVFVLSFSLLAGASFADQNANVNTSTELMVNQATQNYNLINVIKKDQVISKQIYENPSTGYTWVFEVKGDKGVISYTFEDVKVDKKDDVKTQTGTTKPAICGEGTYKQLKIKGLKAGKATLNMKLVRVWEKNAVPAETMSFVVQVK